jgi:hypothetical protein
MSYLLRRIHKAWWDPAYRDEIDGGLAADAIPSDCLADLNTSRCTLSLWQVHDDRSNVGVIAVAVATTRDVAANFDYTLVDHNRVAAIGDLKRTQGESPNVQANNDWHWDLSALSTQKLGELAAAMYEFGSPMRIIRRDVENLIREALRRGEIDHSRVNEKLRAHMGF